MANDRNKLTSVALLFLSSLIPAAQRVDAAEFKCEHLNATILAEESRDAVLACEGVDAALRFLKANGLNVDRDISVEIVRSLTTDGSHEIAGHFSPESNKAIILSYAEFEKFITWLKVPITESLYRSVAAHEAAHIVAVQNFRITEPTIQAQEYIAYVTTLATLDPALREQVMAKCPGDGFETDLQMNATIYLYDPMRFGVEAYRHFIRKGERMDYFQKILEGRVLAD